MSLTIQACSRPALEHSATRTLPFAAAITVFPHELIEATTEPETTRNQARWHTPCGTATRQRWHMKSVVSIAFGLSVIATLVAAVYAAGTPEMIYDKKTKLVEQIASIVHDNKNHCDVMGDKLGRLVANNAALLGEAQKLTPEQTKRVADKYKARGTAARARMVDGLITCRTNAKVKAAIEEGRAWEPRAADDIDAPATDSDGDTLIE